MQSIKEAYRNFLNTDYGSQLYNAFKLVLYRDEDSLVQTLNNSYLQKLPLIKKDILSVCDIGGGDGKRIVHILKFLHDKFGNHFHLDFIEQSKQYIEAFDDTAIKPFGKVTRFHSLFEDVTFRQQYDLVFLIHSIFAFQNGNAIDKVLSLPYSDGKAIVLSNSPTSFLAGLKSLVDEGYADKRYEIDHLERDLAKRHITFSRFTFQTIWAIDDAHYDGEINTLLQWISLGRHKDFSPEKKIIISEYISQHSKRGEGKAIFTEDEVLLVIPSM